MFIDEARILVRGGRGGDGCVSFRREKFVPRGGPDGGAGGAGGSIIFTGDEKLATLMDISSARQYVAGNGSRGGSKKMHGKAGKDISFRIPVGTVVKDVMSGELLCEILEPGQQFVAAKGGKRGRGNAAFATATNQSPTRAEAGEPGQERELFLELKLIADVGLVGLPNAGKSTLLAHISHATPKIAAYPFTTLVPMLGIVEIDITRRLVIADLPGIIEGAHKGIGLGDEFLRHIERTRLLLHIIDCSSQNRLGVVEAHRVIREELLQYSPVLAAKLELLVLNKIDAATDNELGAACKNLSDKAYKISAVTGEGIQELLEAAWRTVAEGRRDE